MSTQAGEPSPQLFFQTANAYQRSHALKAAIELDLFTAIAEGKDTVQALAQGGEPVQADAGLHSVS
jgi:hypothetical protein